MNKDIVRTLGLFAVLALAAPAFAQETQQTQPAQAQPTQAQPAQPSTQAQETPVQETQPQEIQPQTQTQDVSDIVQELREIQEQLEQLVVQLEQQQRAELRSRTGQDLTGIRARIEAGETPEAITRDLSRIRDDLRSGFEGAVEQDRAWADEVDAILDELTQQLTQGRTDTFEQTYDRALALFEQPDPHQEDQQNEPQGLTVIREYLQSLEGDVGAGRYTMQTAEDLAQARARFEGGFPADTDMQRAERDEIIRVLQDLELAIREDRDVQEAYRRAVERLQDSDAEDQWAEDAQPEQEDTQDEDTGTEGTGTEGTDTEDAQDGSTEGTGGEDTQGD
jgi:hypothetical protein